MSKRPREAPAPAVSMSKGDEGPSEQANKENHGTSDTSSLRTKYAKYSHSLNSSVVPAATAHGSSKRPHHPSPDKNPDYEYIKTEILKIVKELRDQPKPMLLLAQVLVGSIGATARQVKSQMYGSCENYERDEIKRVMSRMISLNDGITTRNNVVVPLEDAATSQSRIEERLHATPSAAGPFAIANSQLKSEVKKRKPFQVPRKTTDTVLSSEDKRNQSAYTKHSYSNCNQRREFDEAGEKAREAAKKLPDDAVVDSHDPNDLTEGQQTIVATVLEGKNVFFTGSAGTGKSHVLRICVDAIRRNLASRTGNTEYANDALHVTAPTGIAACNIGGTTIHSFAGIGKGDLDTASLIKKVKSNRQAKERWKQCRVLVIDEISMLEADLFDKLEAIARTIRNRDEPFGAIQLVLCGDFFQLPPVGLSGKKGGQQMHPAHFCFESQSWKMCISESIVLDQIFRQKDQRFVNILNEIRKGQVSPESEAALKSAGKEVAELRRSNSDIKPTLLYALNKDVDRINEQELQKCKGEERAFISKDSGQPNFIEQLKRNCNAPERLKLRVGAQVILLQNLDISRGLVNGTRGIVTEFCKDTESESSVEFPRVKFLARDGEETETLSRKSWTIERGSETLAKREQIPLKLAYALSIHKSQGMTVDLMECSMDGIFDFGQAYVALSRATSLDRMLVRNFNKNCVRAHPRVVEFYASLYSSSKLASNLEREGVKKLNQYLQAKKKEAKNVKSFKAPRTKKPNVEEPTTKTKTASSGNDAEPDTIEDILSAYDFGV